MEINRSGYYKWKARKGQKNRYEQDREVLTELLEEAHKAHRVHGYHQLARDVFEKTGWIFSDNLAHKCCKAAGIHSEARKHTYKKPGEESSKFENLVHGCWNASAPLQIVVSDMTAFTSNGVTWEWTLLVDTFNNEILAHKATTRTGSNKPYYHCLNILNQLAGKKKEEQRPQIVFHTDQGSVYSSRAFCEAHHDYNIIRSMSRNSTN